MNLIFISMGVLGVIAFLAACLLYVVSLYFKVEEDPRIDLVTAVLPGAVGKSRRILRSRRRKLSF